MSLRENTVPLSELKKNCHAKIIRIENPDSKTAARLLELGFVNGTEITSNGKAPFGDPLIFTIHGTKLALRKADAAKIHITTAADQ